MKTLSVSLYNRPDYTKITLDHLSKCYDIENYHVFIFCEPSNNEVIHLAQSFNASINTTVLINPRRIGCNANIFQSLDCGFAINDYHIHIEDDIVPGKDALVFFEWCRHKFRDDPSIYTVSSYCKNTDTGIKEQEKIISRRKWYTPWGWATWKNRWDEIRNILFDHCMRNSHPSWDCIVHKLLGDRYEIYPSVARTQNIGAANGTYCPGPEWHKENQYNEFWIETTKKYTFDFIYKEI